MFAVCISSLRKMRASLALVRPPKVKYSNQKKVKARQAMRLWIDFCIDLTDSRPHSKLKKPKDHIAPKLVSVRCLLDAGLFAEEASLQMIGTANSRARFPS
mmetsp:Transcript_12387/g.20753  ORF Transcript_12387/g.20753 Transcript_12387/m.20753 type:complete len:101 (-) Transcript_12387:3155-3457(-)